MIDLSMNMGLHAANILRKVILLIIIYTITILAGPINTVVCLSKELGGIAYAVEKAEKYESETKTDETGWDKKDEVKRDALRYIYIFNRFSRSDLRLCIFLLGLGKARLLEVVPRRFFRT